MNKKDTEAITSNKDKRLTCITFASHGSSSFIFMRNNPSLNTPFISHLIHFSSTKNTHILYPQPFQPISVNKTFIIIYIILINTHNGRIGRTPPDNNKQRTLTLNKTKQKKKKKEELEIRALRSITEDLNR